MAELLQIAQFDAQIRELEADLMTKTRAFDETKVRRLSDQGPCWSCTLTYCYVIGRLATAD